tara:strand:+ start:4719 stop:5597 length:879 start_codon:yes stop_codon:yes gene_type:complete
MRNLLFVGGSGLLGNNWLKSLSKNKKIFATINKNRINLKKKNITYFKLDLLNEKKISKFIDQNGIDVVINVAALTNIEKCEKNKKKAYEINVKIPKILKKVAKKHSIRFVQLSTDHIYNGKKSGCYSENYKASPLNYYSKTKFFAENFTKDYKKTLIIRTNFFGGYTRNKESFSELILNKIRKKNSIKLWDDVYFTPVNIFFLIKTIERLINRNVFGIINISSSNSISKYDFGIKLCKYFKLNEKYILKNKQNKKTILRPKNMCLSNKKLCKIFPDLKNKLSLDYQIKNIYN